MPRCLAVLLVLCATSAAQAQTSYPMLMSLKPTAAQVGQTSEHEVHSRYSMYGASQILVSGTGVTGEVVTEMKEPKPGETPPEVTALKVKFTVAADAEPGVRDFRVLTPRGVSTLGQLVIVCDPVVSETGQNNTAAQANPVTVPATVCGAIETAEDVDYFKFSVEAGQTLTFHVRSMRLQDRIHDLQQHSDPIIAVRNAAGTTLAQSDNYFAGDPLLSHRFEQAGEYFLEVRDVRYQGNRYWEYSIEISDRPFPLGLHPGGIAPGSLHTGRLIGLNLPADPTVTFDVPAALPLGPQMLRIPTPAGLSDPIPVVVSDLPQFVETDADNNAPAQAQPVTVPAGISGRMETAADIDCYVFEAKKDERFSVEVMARRQRSSLDSIVRILNAQGAQLAENDDGRWNRMNFADSWLENWTAPADGKYVVEIRDLHLRGGESFVYFLKLTRAEPYFELYLDTDKTLLTPGTAGAIFVRAERKNGFSGEIDLSVAGVPPGVTARCDRIPAAGQTADACIILQAAPDAPVAAANIDIIGTASLDRGDGQTVVITARAVPQQETYMPGGGRSHWPVDLHTVSVGASSDLRGVTLSDYDITLKPGESKRIDVRIDRAEGFSQNVTLDLLFRHLGSVFGDTLPAGVTIDAKNSKTLLTGKESDGYITLTADAKAAPIERRQVAVMANVSLNFVMKATYSSPPLFVTVAPADAQ